MANQLSYPTNLHEQANYCDISTAHDNGMTLKRTAVVFFAVLN